MRRIRNGIDDILGIEPKNPIFWVIHRLDISYNLSKILTGILRRNGIKKFRFERTSKKNRRQSFKKKKN